MIMESILRGSVPNQAEPHNPNTSTMTPKPDKAKSVSKEQMSAEADGEFPLGETRPLMGVFKDFPLRGLCVYVEIFSNGTNISETCYSYLEKLGAKIEKRMNKKCNLVIWKDGIIKTIEKAKEYNVHVVNSLWLEDCIENFCCASFEKYNPNLPSEKDLPFISVQNNKKKRKALDSLAPGTFEMMSKEEGKLSATNTSAQRKRRKTNFEQNFESEKKVEIRLGCQRKLSEFFENKRPNPALVSQKSLNVDENLKNFAYNPSNKKKMILDEGFASAKALQPVTTSDNDLEIVERILNSYANREGDSNESSQVNGTSISKQSVEKENEKKEGENVSTVRNMILSYAKTSIFDNEKKPNDISSLSTSEERPPLTERRPSTSSLTKNPERNNENSNVSVSMSQAKVSLKKNQPAKNATDMEKIFLKHLTKGGNQEARNTAEVKEKSVKIQGDMMIEETSNSTKRKLQNEKDKKEDPKTFSNPKESSSKDQRVVRSGQPSAQKNKGRSMTPVEKNAAAHVEAKSGSRSVVAKCESTVVKTYQHSVMKSVVIAKYTENIEAGNKTSTMMCVESRETSSDLSMGLGREKSMLSALTRSQKKRMVLEDLSSNKEGRDSESKGKLKLRDRKEMSSTKKLEESKLNRKEKETKESKENLKPENSKNLLDCGFSKTAQSKERSTPRIKKNTKVMCKEKETFVTPNKEVGSEDSSRISRKKEPKAKNGIIFTNMSGAVLEKPQEFCQKFNFQFLEDELSNMPELELLVYQGAQGVLGSQPNTPESMLPRNYRVAYAMIKGKPIIKKEWVDASLKKEHLQDYEDFKIKYHFGCRKSLFAKMRFCIDKEFEDLPRNMIAKKELLTLITEAGGSTFDNVRACDFYVVKKTPKKKINVPPHVKIITLQWLIDSIIEGKLMNTQHVNYTVF